MKSSDEGGPGKGNMVNIVSFLLFNVISWMSTNSIPN